ncbi:MAG: hypothetical protein JSW45_03200 [Thiotrichales bacterium]|nr:MAG: hypothetical protein JSW45_03200 [Thiotrichales bacterium]
MSKHIFNLRMSATYSPTENAIATLDVEVLADNEWAALELNTLTPGFLIYVYSMFTCQHMFLRTNGAERNLAYASSKGSILVEASEDWFLEKVDVRFTVNLASGNPNEDNTGYIVSRMKQCPVSKNLPEDLDVHTSVEFNND